MTADIPGDEPLFRIWVDRQRREQRVDELLEMVNLNPAEYRELYPAQLSGGQKQRVGVARAFATNPDIILMDEPFSALDEFTRANMQKELLKIWNEDKATVVFITHSIEEAVLLADRVIVMGEGHVLTDTAIDMERSDRVIENTKFLDYVNYFKRFIQDDQTDTEEEKEEEAYEQEEILQ